MRRHLDFYDFALWAVGALLLTLTVPILPGWLQLSATRKLVVAPMFFAGAVSMWAVCYRPRFLKDAPTNHIDLRDWFMVASGLFFAVAACRNFCRWSSAGMTPHRMGIVAVLAIVSWFAFYCIIERGGLSKFSVICFSIGLPLLIPASWKVATGSASPLYFYISEPNEIGYAWLVIALLFVACGIVAHLIQRHRGNRG